LNRRPKKTKLIKCPPVVMLLESGNRLGTSPQWPGPVFLGKMLQLKAYKYPIATTLAPIEYVAPLLQSAASTFAESLGSASDRLSSDRSLSAESLSTYWKRTKRYTLMLENVVQNLSNGLSATEWCDGPPPNRSTRLHQEYTALLRTTRSLGEDMKDTIQYVSSMQTIQETQRGLQQADSVRR